MQKRVLVVDDNDTIRLIVRSTLEMHTPYIVHEAVDGLDALQKAETLNPDLVVMDLSMPRMDGLDASVSLKNSLRPPQVVLFTVNKDNVTDSDADRAGLSAIIEKSEGLEPLLQQVQQLLQTAP
jgi:CheY-like chemotaxis protein